MKPNVANETKRYNEVKQLTFIKMKNSNKINIRLVIKFIFACTKQSGSQCILSRKSSLWIVFAFKSDAQNFLSKLQEIYPDAVISKSPSDLPLAMHMNPYTVKSCKRIFIDETTSDFEADKSKIVEVKPKMAMQVNSQYQSSSTKPSVDIHLVSAKSKASKESVETSQEPQNIVKRDVRGDNELNMFFLCGNYSVSHVIDCQPSKWSLLYNLFEKLYDLGAKKVIYDGNLYCAHFESASAYQDGFERIRSCYLQHLEFVYASETQKQEVTKKMDQYITGIPWCLNQELDLCCLRAKIESKYHADFIEMSKNILRNSECIFVKSLQGEIWIGFPDEIIRENSKKRVDAVLVCCAHNNNVSMAKPSNELLEYINFNDLVGDAYDLVFLSRLLEGSDSIDRPGIIDRISLQRMEEKECNEGAYHITVEGFFSWKEGNPAMFRSLLSLSQIVKIFVNFSKVIPLAATASYERVRLSYYSFYEAEFARHCINKLKTAEVPYFDEFRGVPSAVENSLCTQISEYYIINDKRKVLEKILQNKSLVDKLDSNSSTAQSTSDIDALYSEVAQELFLFVITTNSGFKFTSRMISIIKMHLVDWERSACSESEGEIWVSVDDLEKGNRAKAEIEKIKFKLLHENDEDDFDVGVVVKLVSNCPGVVENKLVNSSKTHMHTNWYFDNDAVPLGHFNYNYRKAVGISTRQYFQSMKLI
uniref:Uncharacterized protein n=1 Tax=Tetranychus urticae TaxID=32264 RepID=T1KGK3_TETUR